MRIVFIIGKSWNQSCGNLWIKGINFQITRYVEKGFIVKEINFDADNKHHRYFEKVKYLDVEKMSLFANAVNFKIKHIFGNYHLDAFNEETSDRLILILEWHI